MLRIPVINYKIQADLWFYLRKHTYYRDQKVSDFEGEILSGKREKERQDFNSLCKSVQASEKKYRSLKACSYSQVSFEQLSLDKFVLIYRFEDDL